MGNIHTLGQRKKHKELEPDMADLFTLTPNGYGCKCNKCRREFMGKREWYRHAHTCFPDLIISEPVIERQKAVQEKLPDTGGFTVS